LGVVVRLDSLANTEQIIYSENCPETYQKSFETLLNQSFEYLQFNKNQTGKNYLVVNNYFLKPPSNGITLAEQSLNMLLVKI
jgi:hypothetical protein